MEFNLPSTISEIHFGFLSGKHFIGTVDVGQCKHLEITFENSEWVIKAEYNGETVEKHYKNRIGNLGIPEITNKKNLLPD